tara:strand:- start:194 stop:514 length:321 start_codon:yes stop_codon:yes gene_type:complete
MSETFSTRSSSTNYYQELEKERANLKAKIQESCPPELIEEYKTLQSRLLRSDEVAHQAIRELTDDIWKNTRADKKYLEEKTKELQDRIEMLSGLRLNNLFSTLMNG